MRIPYTINPNTFKAYDIPNIYTRQENIKSDNFAWDMNFILTLRELCLVSISTNWEKKPLYEELEIPSDRLFVLEILSSDLPLELTVPIIEEDCYWQRCYHDRWPKAPPPKRIAIERKRHIDSSDYEDEIEELGESPNHRNSLVEEKIESRNSIQLENQIIPQLKDWKQCFLENHLEEELEKMLPDEFKPEYIKELTDLCSDYIICLNIKQLKSSTTNGKTDHISLHSLLARLTNLVEFSVCFNQANQEDNFSWQATIVSENDCQLLGNGIEKSNIEIFRITRSNIDCGKIKLITRSLNTHKFLRVLDFSHCKISDEGAMALAEGLKTNVTVAVLTLVNNIIGSKGAEAFTLYLCENENKLIELNLKLNPLGVQGGKYLTEAISKGAKTLQTLSIAACGLTSENLQIGDALALNSSLQKLDLSNNHLGEETGQTILEGLAHNNTLTQLDLRMCGITPDTVHAIEARVRKYIKRSRGIIKTPTNSQIVTNC